MEQKVVSEVLNSLLDAVSINVAGNDVSESVCVGKVQLRRKIPLRKCEECEKEIAKYRCPRCYHVTCSVGCVTSHKVRTGCTGIRDPAKYIPIKQFTDLDLLSDYRFLEESARVIDNAARNSATSRLRFFHDKPQLPFPLKRLVDRARSSGCQLHILPAKFSKRIENTTKCRDRIILWHIEWDLVLADRKIVSYDVPETSTVQEALSRLDFDSLFPYCDTRISDLRVLMKAEMRPAHDPKYHIFDLDATLRENLARTVIVEYPTLVVVTKEHADAFPLMDYLTLSERNKDKPGNGLPKYFAVV